MKRLLYLLVLTYPFLLLGCATKINQIKGTYNTVEVSLNEKSDDSFYLKSATKGVLSAATANNAKIVFIIPESSASSIVNECYFITNKEGEIVNFNHSNNNGFSNPLLNKYLQQAYQINSAKNNIASAQAAINNYHLQYKDALDKLKASGIFKQGQCVQAYLKEQPMLACEPAEKEAKSKAVCLVKNLGCDGFSGLAGSAVGSIIGKGVVSLLSDVGCDVIASELLGEENSMMSDVAKNTALTVIGTWGGWWGKAIVLGAKVYDFNVCLDAVESKCTEKYQQWRNEPIKLQQQCQSHANIVAQIPDKIQSLKANLEAKVEQLNNQNNALYQFKNKKLNLNADCLVR